MKLSHYILIAVLMTLAFFLIFSIADAKGGHDCGDVGHGQGHGDHGNGNGNGHGGGNDNNGGGNDPDGGNTGGGISGASSQGSEGGAGEITYGMPDAPCTVVEWWNNGFKCPLSESDLEALRLGGASEEDIDAMK
jgi:hypothetical protein